MGVIGKNIGKLPVYCGEWSETYNGGNGYPRYGNVSFAGSLFINIVEGNKSAPCELVYDSSGYLVSYVLGEGWNFAANALDASIQVTQYSRLNRFYAVEVVYKQ